MAKGKQDPAPLAVTVEEEGAVQRSLRVEVPASRVDASFARAYRDLGRRVRVRGFRPGKAPRHVLEKLYGPSMAEELERTLVEQSLPEALQEAGLEPVARPAIEAEPPECDNWNFQLDNHWMESLDYRYFRVTINKHTASKEPDGSVKIIVAHDDPGHPNWIETAGHQQGTMCFRWIRADRHPQPACRVVKLSELS